MFKKFSKEVVLSIKNQWEDPFFDPYDYLRSGVNNYPPSTTLMGQLYKEIIQSIVDEELTERLKVHFKLERKKRKKKKAKGRKRIVDPDLAS